MPIPNFMLHFALGESWTLHDNSSEGSEGAGEGAGEGVGGDWELVSMRAVGAEMQRMSIGSGGSDAAGDDGGSAGVCGAGVCGAGVCASDDGVYVSANTDSDSDAEAEAEAAAEASQPHVSQSGKRSYADMVRVDTPNLTAAEVGYSGVSYRRQGQWRPVFEVGAVLCCVCLCVYVCYAMMCCAVCVCVCVCYDVLCCVCVYVCYAML
jgi:hypothetical protein